jgi:phage gp37-like protein
MFEDTKGANRNRKSTDRQQNGLNKIDKGTNNDLQNTT